MKDERGAVCEAGIPDAFSRVRDDSPRGTRGGDSPRGIMKHPGGGEKVTVTPCRRLNESYVIGARDLRGVPSQDWGLLFLLLPRG